MADSHFALTEFDLNPPLQVNSSFQYASPLPVPTLAGAASLMYPYTYGIDIPNQTGAVTDANSPLFVEKLAGVDSPGMLVSLLQMLNLTSRTDPTLLTRFSVRTGLSSYAQVVTSGATPWADYASSGATAWSVTPQWFLNNSYVVTDLTTARPGDLLVGYEGSELSVAIVVGLTSDVAPMDRLLVLTINRTTKRAVYTKWSTMSLAPEQYHLRRLAVTSDTPATTGFLADPQTQLTYDLVRTDPDNFKQWIPNTGELGYLGRIALKDASGADLSDLVEGATWTVGGAVNFSSAVQNPGAAFSQTNQKTVFHLVALTAAHQEDGISVLPPAATAPGALPSNSQYIDVCTFEPQNGQAYKLNPLTAPWKLVVKDRALAVFNTQTGVPYRFFAIVATTQAWGNPVPGDDITISFVVHSSFGDLVTDLTKAPRLAVYDKKMLWRANLYVDEGGPNDWNNLHPWVTGNEWNYHFDGLKFSPGDGKQVVSFRNSNLYIPLRPQGDAGKPTDTASSVSYEYPDGVGGTSTNLFQQVVFDTHGYDSPFDFLYKMNQMKLKLSSKFLNISQASGSLGGSSSALTQGGSISTTQLAQWNTFRAPKDWWQNYPTDLDINYLPDLGLLNASRLNLEPGITDDFVKTKLIPIADSLFGAGTDCLGFVSRAAGYKGRPYTWPNLPSKDAAETYGLAGTIPNNLVKLDQGTRNVSYPDPAVGQPATVMFSSSVAPWSTFFNAVANGNNNIADSSAIALFRSLIPGDVIFYDHAHIGMILSIDPISQGMSYQALANSIHIIESTFMGQVNYGYL